MRTRVATTMLVATTGLASLALPATAWADEEPEEEKSIQDEPEQWHVLDFMTFGVGLVGQVGVAILDKPDDQTVGGIDYTANSEYPGFVGVASAIGPAIEFRFLWLWWCRASVPVRQCFGERRAGAHRFDQPAVDEIRHRDRPERNAHPVALQGGASRRMGQSVHLHRGPSS